MKKKIIILAILASFAGTAANAQQRLESGYFVDTYNYRHQLNPAFASSRSYFSILGLGNTSLTLQGNVGVSNFLYPYRDGMATTFMNSSVSAEQFLSGLKKNNKLGADFSLPVVSVGQFGRKGGFTTVEFNIRNNASVNLPYELFDFMKNIGARQTYDISNIAVRTQAYAELALGHAHKITDRLNVGAKVKFLVGLANADARIDNMHVSMNENSWDVTASGSINASFPGLKMATKGETGTATDPSENNEVDFDALGDGFDEINSAKDIFSSMGYGVAFDLGASYEFDSGLLEGLSLSASVLDLGFISWGKAVSATTGSNSWTFDGFDDISFESGENSLSEQINSLGDSFSDLLKFERQGESKGKSGMLACTVNVGAEYEMPFYRNLSVGVLSSTRIAGPYSHSEGRLSVNVEPTDWFGFSTSYGISTFGSTWGAVASFSFPGIGLFIGTDTIPLRLARINSVSVPYGKLNLNLNFGLSFNISKVRELGERK